jgi:hypothetical protein
MSELSVLQKQFVRLEKYVSVSELLGSELSVLEQRVLLLLLALLSLDATFSGSVYVLLWFIKWWFHLCCLPWLLLNASFSGSVDVLLWSTCRRRCR